VPQVAVAAPDSTVRPAPLPLPTPSSGSAHRPHRIRGEANRATQVAQRRPGPNAPQTAHRLGQRSLAIDMRRSSSMPTTPATG
jgi:hypothetical protein